MILAVSLSAACAQGKPLEKPNVLFIMIDDLRPQLGCYGHTETISPNIDRLAEQALVFDRAYVQVPVCGASRASTLTGLYPTATRFVNYHSEAQKDAPGIVDIPSHFKANGYTTVSNGKIYHGDTDNNDSWDDIFRVEEHKIYHKSENLNLPENDEPPFEDADVDDLEYAGGREMQKTINDLRRAKAAGTPFFIATGFTKPHLPFNAPKKYWNLYDPEKLALADNPFVPKGAPRSAIHNFGELRNRYGGVPKKGPIPEDLARKLIHGYYACVSYSDALVGKLLDELDRLELRDNTIVILMGDHGWQLGEHALWCKHALFNTSTLTPLIISAPGYKEGRHTEAMVEFVDIYPSLCELAGLPLPKHLQGRSFVPLLKEPSRDWKIAAFSRYRAGDSVSTERYSYSEWPNGHRMLYDHKKDLDENVNVSENPEYKAVIKKMQKLLQEHKDSV
jgi:arylsulfatase A-like enzyme